MLGKISEHGGISVHQIPMETRPSRIKTTSKIETTRPADKNRSNRFLTKPAAAININAVRRRRKTPPGTGTPANGARG
jgi:hypothetical protein